MALFVELSTAQYCTHPSHVHMKHLPKWTIVCVTNLKGFEAYEVFSLTTVELNSVINRNITVF